MSEAVGAAAGAPAAGAARRRPRAGRGAAARDRHRRCRGCARAPRSGPPSRRATDAWPRPGSRRRSTCFATRTACLTCGRATRRTRSSRWASSTRRTDSRRCSGCCGSRAGARRRSSGARVCRRIAWRASLDLARPRRSPVRRARSRHARAAGRLRARRERASRADPRRAGGGARGRAAPRASARGLEAGGLPRGARALRLGPGRLARGEPRALRSDRAPRGLRRPAILSAARGRRRRRRTRRRFRSPRPRPDALSALRRAAHLDGRSIGSSAFVVGGAHTRSGRPILAGDSHLEPTWPPLLHVVHLQGGALDVAGSTLPGVPIVWTGRNRTRRLGRDQRPRRHRRSLHRDAAPRGRRRATTTAAAGASWRSGSRCCACAAATTRR